MNNLRKNSITGIIESQGITETSLHFSEWWNGEGMDFTFDENKRINLHIDEIHSLMVAVVASEMIDIGSVMEDVANLKVESKKREEDIERIRGKYGL